MTAAEWRVKICSKIPSPEGKEATPKGLALENGTEGCYNFHSDGWVMKFCS